MRFFKKNIKAANLHVNKGMTQSFRQPSEQHIETPLQSSLLLHSSIKLSGGHWDASRRFLVGHPAPECLAVQFPENKVNCYFPRV